MNELLLRYCAQSSGWDGGVQTSMPIAKQFQLSVDFPTEVCSYSIFYIQISRFWVDLSEIGAKTLSSQSQISELLFKRFSLQSSEWSGVVDSSMLTVKQLQPAISFITEVFAIFNFGIQFIFVDLTLFELISTFWALPLSAGFKLEVSF